MTIRELTQEARRQGWAVEPTGGGHLRLTPPNTKAGIYMSATPRVEHLCVVKTLARMKKAGFRLPKERKGRERIR